MKRNIDKDCCQLYWRDENWVLHPQRGIYWPKQQLLMVADTHFGKIKHFQNTGIPIPGEKESKTYGRLEKLVRAFQPKKIAILGDLFHSKYNSAWEQYVDWMETHENIEFHLVRGNHDILNDSLYQKVGMVVHEENWQIGEITLTHNPVAHDSGIQIGGHIHPGVRLEGRGKQKLKLPCFYFSSTKCILPALGYFTGLASLEINKGDRVFVTTAERVIEI